jgi:cytochrome c biogenesis protein CcdA
VTGGYLLGALSALWLGVLTSVSPCPLATNIAAVSFVGRRVDRPRLVVLAGVIYSLGRMLAYLALGFAIVAGLLSMPAVSRFLQTHLNRLLGPVLILTGMVLLDLLPLPALASPGGRYQGLAERGGVWGAGLLGFLFALALCPASAAIFFGSLIPLSLSFDSRVAFPALFGLGTAIPVLIFAFTLAAGTRSVGKLFDAVQRLERWIRTATGVLFVAVGIWYSLVYLWGFRSPLG